VISFRSDPCPTETGSLRANVVTPSSEGEEGEPAIAAEVSASALVAGALLSGSKSDGKNRMMPNTIAPTAQSR